jgi:hypothetical protein
MPDRQATTNARRMDEDTITPRRPGMLAGYRHASKVMAEMGWQRWTLMRHVRLGLPALKIGREVYVHEEGGRNYLQGLKAR